MKKVMRMSKVALVSRFVLIKLCVFTATGVSCALEPAPPSAPAAFRIAELSVSPIVVEPGEEVTIKAKVTNIGGSIGSYTAELKLNDVIEVAREVDLALGTSQPLRFSVYKDTPGTYTVTLGELTGNFVVLDTAPPTPAPPTRFWVLTDAEATDLLRRALDIGSIARTEVQFMPDNKVVFKKDPDKLTTTANIYEGKLYLFGVRPEEWAWLQRHIGSYTSYSKPKTKLYLTGLPPWFDPTKEIASDVTELPTFVSITTEVGRAIITYLRP